MRIAVTYENGEIFNISDILRSLRFMMCRTAKLLRPRL